MPFAITLLLDAAATTSVEDIWQTLAREIDEDSSIRLGYPPHITIAAFEDAVSDEEFRAAISIENLASFPVQLYGLGAFPGQPFVFWAAPIVTQELLSLHATVLAAFAHLPVHHHYGTEAWVPHVTLTQSTKNRPARIFETVVSAWKGPIQGHATKLELVEFPPARMLSSHTLPQR
jgi:2'-5' RNA ligase